MVPPLLFICLTDRYEFDFFLRLCYTISCQEASKANKAERKKLEKKFEKPLDKAANLWYNEYIK